MCYCHFVTLAGEPEAVGKEGSQWRLDRKKEINEILSGTLGVEASSLS